MDEHLAAPREHPPAAAFAGVFSACLLGMLAVGAVLPVLPRYVHGPIGAGDVAVGVVIGAFAVLAVVGRPFGGRLADRRGRRRIVVAGLTLSGLAGLGYFAPLGVPGLVVARMLLGLGEGWSYTASAAWIVDLAPPARRGQAIGLFGMAVWGGLAAGPVIGEVLYDVASYEAVWAFAAGAPLVGALVASRVPETWAPQQGAETGRGPLIPPGVALPGIALSMSSFGYGAVSAFLILHLAERGIGDGAAVFAAFAGAVVVTRLAASGLPDRLGPHVTARFAFAADAAGLAVVALAQTLPVALAGAVVMGVGFSLLFPSLALIVIDRVGEARRGAAMGAFTAFFDLGVGLGAPVAGAVAALAGYEAAFWVAAGAALVGLALGRVRPGPRVPHAPPEATPA